MVGLLGCLYSIPNFIGSILFGLETRGLNAGVSNMQIFSSSIGIGLIAVCSVLLIALSQRIAVWLFKDDE
jgi:type III secretory pathway component EscV